MADTLFTKALVRAAEVHGSTQSLASSLRVPENTLLRWMSGRAQMPLQAFLHVIALVSEDERKQSVEPVPQAAAKADKLHFRIGQLEARCERCNGVEFVPAEPARDLRYIDPLRCTTCGKAVIHGELVARLARDSVYHSKAPAAQRQKPQLRLLKTH